MVRRARLFQRRILVKLGVRRGVIAAVIKGRVGFRFSMIGIRLARDLPSGQAASVGEGRQENSVDRALLLKNIQRRLDPFVHKRNRAGLNADHPWRGGLFSGLGGGKKRRRNGCRRSHRRGRLDKLPARQLRRGMLGVHIWS